MKELTNRNLSHKMEKLSSNSQTLLTEDAILRSSMFQAVLTQARGLADEASKCEELKAKLVERSSQLSAAQREKAEAITNYKQN